LSKFEALKLIAKITKILTLPVIIFIVIIGLLYTSLRSYTFQNKVVQVAIAKLSADMQTKITLKKVDIGWWKKATFHDLLILDQAGDTLIYAEKLKIHYTSINRELKEIRLKELTAINTKVHFEKLKNAEKSNYAFFINYFKPKKKKDPRHPKIVWTIIAKNVLVINSQFRYHDYNSPVPSDRRFDQSFIEFNQITGAIDTLKIIDDSLSFRIKNLYTKEKSGLTIMGLSANTIISAKKLGFYNMNLATPYSLLKNQLVMKYNSYDDFGDFVNKVDLEANLENAIVSLKDIAYFYEPWWGQNKIFTLSGVSEGPIKRLDVKQVDLRYGLNTQLQGKFDFSGLPDINNTLLDFSFTKLETNMDDFSILAGIKNLSPELRSIGNIKFKGELIGFSHDFVARGNWETTLGKAKTDLKFAYNPKIGLDAAAYKGKLSTDNFNLAPLIAGSNLSNFSGEITLDGSGLNSKNVNITTQSKINSIIYDNKKIVNALIDGKLAKGLFEGEINVNDPNLDCFFKGNINLNLKQPLIYFDANLRNVNLTYFGLDTGISSISGVIKSNLVGNGIDDIEGNLIIESLKINKNNTTYVVNNAMLLANNNQQKRNIYFYSDILDLSLEGDFRLKNLPLALNNILWNLLPGYFDYQVLKTTEIVDFNLNLKEPELLLNYIPNYLILEKTKLAGAYNSKDNTLAIDLVANKLGIYDIAFQNLQVAINKQKDKPLIFSVSANQLFNKNKPLTDNLLLLGEAANNKLNLQLKTKSDSLNYSAFVDGELLFSKALIDIKINQSDFKINNRNWEISKNGEVQYADGNILLNNIVIGNKTQKLSLNGNISKDPISKLLIDFENFQLGDLLFDLGYLKKDTLKGIANGNISIANFYKIPAIESDFNLKNIVFNRDTLGALDVKIVNLEKNIFKIDGTHITEGPLKGVYASGNINIDEAAENFDLKLALPKSEIKLLSNFMDGLFSNISGFITGEDLALVGKFKKPILTGKIKLEEANFTVDYLNTSLAIAKAEIDISQNAFTIKPCRISDINKKTGIVGGSVNHTGFDKWRFDIAISNIDNMLLLNTTKEQNDLYYGKGFATGYASFKGPIDELDIYMNLKTEKGTKLTLPLESEDARSDIPYIHFKKEANNQNRRVKKAFSNINSIVIEIQATEDAEAEMIFDSKVGDIMRGSGNGDLKFELNKAADLFMYGTYVIARGSYLFTAFNFVNKPFTIEKGGVITWDGDPFDAKLNLTAIYKQKVSLAPLIDPSQYSRQEDYNKAAEGLKAPVDVNSEIKLTGVLFQPKIDFDIDLQGAQTQGNYAIEISQMKTRLANDPQELNKQFLSLLVFNRFLPVNNLQIGTVAIAAPGQSASELLSSQLNNWISDVGFGKLIDNISFDLGRDTGNQRQVVVNIEKVLYERIKFKGAIAAGTAASTASNYSLEYDITKDGNLKLRTNYTPFYFSNLNTVNGQQGLGSRRGTVGVFFRREFETIFKKNNNKK